MDEDVKARFAALVAMAKQVDEAMGPPPSIDEDTKNHLLWMSLEGPYPRTPSRHAHLLPEYDQGESIPETRCMRWGCTENRWKHPSAGPLVLCQEHGREVVEGWAKAPPLRQRIDYQSCARKTFLVEHLPAPDDEKPR